MVPVPSRAGGAGKVVSLRAEGAGKVVPSRAGGAGKVAATGISQFAGVEMASGSTRGTNEGAEGLSGNGPGLEFGKAVTLGDTKGLAVVEGGGGPVFVGIGLVVVGKPVNRVGPAWTWG